MSDIKDKKSPWYEYHRDFIIKCSYLFTWNFVTPFLMKSTI